MLIIPYPEPAFRIKEDAGNSYIFDAWRKKWVVLTPEEWVRQNFISYLVRVLDYSAARIAVEKEIRVGELRKRFDILVYDPSLQPWMMVECKSAEVPLDDSVVQQLLRYHSSTPVACLVVTNGNQTYAWQRTEKGFEQLDALPPAIAVQ